MSGAAEALIRDDAWPFGAEYDLHRTSEVERAVDDALRERYGKHAVDAEECRTNGICACPQGLVAV